MWCLCVAPDSARKYLGFDALSRELSWFSEYTLKNTKRMSTQRQTLIFDAKTPSTPQSDDVSPMAIDVPISENATKVRD